MQLEKFNLTLIGVIKEQNRNDFIFNPKKDTYTIEQRDIFIVIGYKESINQFRIDLLSSKPQRTLNAK